jgi:hypothetical protein
MQIDFNDEQRRNVSFSIRFSREFPSNIILLREVQSVKQNSPIIVTDSGMQIDCSDKQQENARCSISASFDPCSKVHTESC